jgi:hypothetical protein
MPRGRTKIEFTDFWDAYGRKFDRTAALRAWGRLTDLDRRAALRGIAAYREACQQQGIAMMYPSGYLAHRRWEDEREETVSCSKFQVLGSRSGTKKELSEVSGNVNKPETRNQKPETSGEATLADMETW